APPLQRAGKSAGRAREAAPLLGRRRFLRLLYEPALRLTPRGLPVRREHGFHALVDLERRLLHADRLRFDRVDGHGDTPDVGDPVAVGVAPQPPGVAE